MVMNISIAHFLMISILAISASRVSAADTAAKQLRGGNAKVAKQQSNRQIWYYDACWMKAIFGVGKCEVPDDYIYEYPYGYRRYLESTSDAANNLEENILIQDNDASNTSPSHRQLWYTGAFQCWLKSMFVKDIDGCGFEVPEEFRPYGNGYEYGHRQLIEAVDNLVKADNMVEQVKDEEQEHH